MENNWKGTKGEALDYDRGNKITVEINHQIICERSKSAFTEETEKLREDFKAMANGHNIRQQIDCSLPELLERYKKMEKALSKLVEETEDHVANGATDEEQLQIAREMARQALNH